MRIPRNTKYIKAQALTNSNAFDNGDVVEFKRDFQGWHMTNQSRPFNTYSAFISHIRNDNLFHIIEMH